MGTWWLWKFELCLSVSVLVVFHGWQHVHNVCHCAVNTMIVRVLLLSLVIGLTFQGTDDEWPIVKFIYYATYKHENSDKFWNDDSDIKAWSGSNTSNNATSGNTDDAQCTDCSGLGPWQTGYLLTVIIFSDIISLISHLSLSSSLSYYCSKAEMYELGSCLNCFLRFSADFRISCSSWNIITHLCGSQTDRSARHTCGRRRQEAGFLQTHQTHARWHTSTWCPSSICWHRISPWLDEKARKTTKQLAACCSQGRTAYHTEGLNSGWRLWRMESATVLCRLRILMMMMVASLMAGGWHDSLVAVSYTHLTLPTKRIV